MKTQKIKSQKDRCQIFSSCKFNLHVFSKINIWQSDDIFNKKLKENEVFTIYFELSKKGFLSITRSINLENEVEIESKCDKTQKV